MPVSSRHNIDISLLPFVDEAKKYYISEYGIMSGARKIKLEQTIKYFDILKKVYLGKTCSAIEKSTGISRSTIYNQCNSTQNKIELYLKLKELGRL